MFIHIKKNIKIDVKIIWYILAVIAVLGSLIFGFYYISSDSQKNGIKPVLSADDVDNELNYSFHREIYSIYSDAASMSASKNYSGTTLCKKLKKNQYLRYNENDIPVEFVTSKRVELVGVLEKYFKKNDKVQYVADLKFKGDVDTSKIIVYKLKDIPVFVLNGYFDKSLSNVLKKFCNYAVVNAVLPNCLNMCSSNVSGELHKKYNDSLNHDNRLKTLDQLIKDNFKIINGYSNELRCFTGGCLVTLGNPDKKYHKNPDNVPSYKYILHTVYPKLKGKNVDVKEGDKLALKTAILSSLVTADSLLNVDYVILPFLSVDSFNFPLEKNAEQHAQALFMYATLCSKTNAQMCPIIISIYNMDKNFNFFEVCIQALSNIF